MKRQTIPLAMTLSVVMVLAMALLLPGKAQAKEIASGPCGADGTNVTWSLDDAGTLTINGSGEMGWKGIWGPNPWDEQKDTIKKVTISEGVTDIHDFQFYCCSNLTDITLPNSISKIGKNAFDGCSSLTAITIPNTVISIGEWAFHFCSDLYSIALPSKLTSIETGTFSNCSSLKSVAIPDSVTAIGDVAFNTCSELEDITIPNSVTSIGGSAFEYCKSLNNVTLPSGLTTIYNSTFAHCTNLNRIAIPKNVTKVESLAFEGCENLRDIILPNTLTNIGNVFYGHPDFSNIYYTGTKEQWWQVEDRPTNYTNTNIYYNCTPFFDVLPDSFCFDSVKWAVAKNITSGTRNDAFSPAVSCTHNQILTFLWRTNGSPSTSMQSAFPSISGDYGKAAAWAYEKALISTDYDGDKACTRAEAVTYLWKLAGKPTEGNASFSDVPAGQSYAQAVSWAVSQGITQGTSATTFSPDTACNRGQIVTFLYRAMK